MYNEDLHGIRGVLLAVDEMLRANMRETWVEKELCRARFELRD